MKVAGAITEVLRREGVTLANCFPTTALIDAMAGSGIRPIICRQERAGMDAANGYARVTNGDPVGVFAMQNGPGAENAFPGIASAFSDSTPILLLPTGHPRAYSQVQPLFSPTRVYAPVTRYAEALSAPDQIVPIMRRAFNALKNGRRGPVMVEIPLDLVNAEVPDGTLDYTPVPTYRSAADPASVDAAIALLLSARCPIIFAGQGVLYAQATQLLVELAQLLQAPVVTTVDGKSAFPEDHPLSLGTACVSMPGPARHFLLQSDAVLAIGASLTRHAMYPTLPAGKRLVHATNDPRDVSKAYETDIALLGDAELMLGQLAEAARDRLGRATRTQAGAVEAEIQGLHEAWMTEWMPKLQSNQTPITPYRVIWELMAAVDPATAIVTHDSGSPRDQLLPFYRATRPRSYLGWGKSHQLGTGLGLAIGAKLAAPDALCVNLIGDAAFGMTGLDFETAVRCNAPILTIVFNNSTMACETGTLQLSHERFATRDLGGDYAALARDLGGHGERIEDPNEIATSIVRARKKTEDGTPVLLEFITNEELAFSHRLDPLFAV